jgi:nucleoid-associated protein YgaU
MPIYLGSRYETALVDFVALSPRGDAAPVVFYEFSDLGRMTYAEYRWQAGDRLDALAMEYYRDPERWWIIAEANPEVLDIQNIPAGTVLRVPSV